MILDAGFELEEQAEELTMVPADAGARDAVAPSARAIEPA